MYKDNIMKLIVLPLLLTLTGCSIFTPKPPPEPVVVVEIETIPLRIYQPLLPEAIVMEDVEFSVISKENLDKQIEKMERVTGAGFVFFGLTPQGYESMSANIQEIKRYILQQKEIIMYYREATTVSDGTTAKDWVKRNERKDLTPPDK